MAKITRHTAIKFIELVLVCILIGFSVGSGYSYLSSGTSLGYLIILVGAFIAEIMGIPVDRRINLYYCLVGAVLFIVVGVIWLIDNHSAVVGVISVVNGVVFLIDAYLVYKKKDQVAI